MTKKTSLHTARTILIRAVNWIGDAVMTMPAIGLLRHHCADAHITVLANPLVAQLYKGHPWVDDVITFDRSGTHHGVMGRMYSRYSPSKPLRWYFATSLGYLVQRQGLYIVPCPHWGLWG